MLSKMVYALKNFLVTNNVKTDKNLLITTAVYLLILVILRWQLHPGLEIIFFLAGGLLGVYFLDLAEAIFKFNTSNQPSDQPTSSRSSFKNVLFQGAFVFLALFVITSSGSLFGAGMILAMYLGMLISQYHQLMATGNLNSWFWPIKTEITVANQKIYLGILAGFFLLLNLLFI